MTNEERLDDMTKQIKGNYDKYYFSSQVYLDEDDGWLAPALPIPSITEFFGPRSFVILILSKPYGWIDDVFDWPPEKLETQIDQLKDVYSQWAEYKVHVYIDTTGAEDSALDKLLVTADAIETTCGELKDFGVIYKGILPEDYSADTFKEDMDDWYHIT
jgi:hypothetical protein